MLLKDSAIESAIACRKARDRSRSVGETEACRDAAGKDRVITDFSAADITDTDEGGSSPGCSAGGRDFDRDRVGL